MTADERQQSAMCLQAKVQAAGWELHLDENGSLLVRIGDDLAGVPQHVTLAALFMFEPEFTRLLAAQVH